MWPFRKRTVISGTLASASKKRQDQRKAEVELSRKAEQLARAIAGLCGNEWLEILGPKWSFIVQGKQLFILPVKAGKYYWHERKDLCAYGDYQLFAEHSEAFLEAVENGLIEELAELLYQDLPGLREGEERAGKIAEHIEKANRLLRPAGTSSEP